MSAIRGFLHRLKVLVAPEAYAREVEREIRFHLELEAMQQRAGGAPELEAELAARRRFGNVTYAQEEVRVMNGLHFVDRLRQNVGYGVRGLRRSPAYMVGVVLTLGLGLGVNAAMYSFLDRVFLRPPAGVVRPEEVRRVYFDVDLRDRGRAALATLRWPQLREVIRNADSTIHVGLFTDDRDSISVALENATRPARRRLANTAYFEALGVKPHLGRFFDVMENRIETPSPVAVISHAFWRRAFNSNPAAIGSHIRIGKRAVTIVGVAAPGFAGIDLDRVDLWMPLGNYNIQPPEPGSPPWYETFHSSFSIVTRFATAEAERRFLDVSTTAIRSVRIPRFSFDTLGFLRTGPIQAAAGPATKSAEVSIAIRLGGVALIVLLIAMANVSNLMLVRALQRAREFAVRRALGVSRWRLFEQLLTESVLLAILGGAVSIVLAFWVGSAMRALLMPRVSWAAGVLDLSIAGVVGLAALLVGVLVGILPALRSWEPDLTGALKSGSKGAGMRGSRLRATMLVAQAALSVVLLVGAGLFVRSLGNVRSIDVGYDVAPMIQVTASGERNLTEDLRQIMPALMERVGKIPGVEVVAAASSGPMRGYGFEGTFLPGRDSVPRVGGERGASFANVTRDYFTATGLRIIAGRGFGESDATAVVVDKRMADAWWPGESALGKCIIRKKADGPCSTVIGVTEAVNGMGILGDQYAMYFVNDEDRPRNVLVVRADPDRHDAVVQAIKEEFPRLLPIADYVRAVPLVKDLEFELRPWRLGATLFTAMGVLALVVAAIGVYSVVSYAASQRTHEVGVRVALGAQMQDILRLIVGGGLRTVLIGVVFGIGLALAGGKLVASLLYGVSPRDPVVIVGAAVVLGMIGAAATLLPALRAARVDPVSSLRIDS